MGLKRAEISPHSTRITVTRQLSIAGIDIHFFLDKNAQQREGETDTQKRDDSSTTAALWLQGGKQHLDIEFYNVTCAHQRIEVFFVGSREHDGQGA